MIGKWFFMREQESSFVSGFVHTVVLVYTDINKNLQKTNIGYFNKKIKQITFVSLYKISLIKWSEKFKQKKITFVIQIFFSNLTIEKHIMQLMAIQFKKIWLALRRFPENKFYRMERNLRITQQSSLLSATFWRHPNLSLRTWLIVKLWVFKNIGTSISHRNR